VPISLKTFTLSTTSPNYDPFSFTLPKTAPGNPVIVTINVGSANTCQQNVTGAWVKY
jgi:hypothetical protein